MATRLPLLVYTRPCYSSRQFVKLRLPVYNVLIVASQMCLELTEELSGEKKILYVFFRGGSAVLMVMVMVMVMVRLQQIMFIGGIFV